MITKKALMASLVFGLAFAIIGCSDDDSGTSASSVATGEVRVAHLSPDAPNVDVAVDGSVVLSNVPYEAISEYLAVPSGPHTVTVTPAGATAPVVIDADVNVGANTSSTIAATGLLGAGDLQPLPLADDRITTGQAKVRFVHTSPDAPAVDIAIPGGQVVPGFRNIAFRESSNYVALDAGTYDLDVRVNGTRTVALSLEDVNLAPGTNYTVFATGLLADGSLGALVAVDAP
jgi:hypothetical protein